MKNLDCDSSTGICQIADDNNNENNVFEQQNKSTSANENQKIDVYYITDPVCSFCWAVEPEINRFKSEYSEYMNFKTVMGGLVKKWDASENLETERKMKQHWIEVCNTYRMPTDGSMWTKDTLTSSYIPSQVYSVLEDISPELANVFLRRIREATYIENRNPANEELLISIIKNSIDYFNENNESLSEIYLPEEILEKSISDEGYNLLRKDFAIRSSFGISSFPSMVIVGSDGNSMLVAGRNDYESYDYAFKEMYKSKVTPKEPVDLSKLNFEGKYLFSKEIEEMYSISKENIEAFLSENLDTKKYKTIEILGELALTRV